MDETDIPTKIPLKWAASAAGSYINSIPTASQIGITNGAASFTDGFPPLNFVPISAGGYPPRGSDFNGILQQVTAGLQWIQAGGLFSYDAAFASVIGGYARDAVIQSNLYPGLLWVSLADNNVDNPDLSTQSTWLPFNRWRLTADTTFYVNDITGNDDNSGLTPSVPFQTITRACDVLGSFVDLSGFVATVRIASGTYDSPINMQDRLVGASQGARSVVFLAQDGAVAISTISPHAGSVIALNGAAFTLRGNDFILAAPSGPADAVIACISASESGSIIEIDGNISFGLAQDVHVYAGPGSQIRYLTGHTMTITDDAPFHWQCINGFINIASDDLAIILSGTPAFSQAFVQASLNGACRMIGLTIPSGTATGKRYDVKLNGTIDTNGGGANYFPGDVPGTDATGGIYA